MMDLFEFLPNSFMVFLNRFCNFAFLIFMMHIYPESFYGDIEFDQILEMAAGMARGSKAGQFLRESRPLTEFQLWKSTLDSVSELAILLRDGEKPPLGNYADISSVFPHLAIQDYILDLEEILKIWEVLSVLTALRQWGKKKEIRSSDIYQNYIAFVDPELEKIDSDLSRIFYPDGAVRENATPALKRLYRQKEVQEKNISAAFQQVLQKYKARNL